MSDISKTIIAKSDQLNACDLIGGGVIYQVVSTVVNTREDQPVSINLSGDGQPYKPCLSMRRVLAKLWGVDSKLWVGRSIQLFCDPSAMWAGEKVGGIRISALSDINKDERVVVRASKHKVIEYLITKINGIKVTISDVLTRIKSAKNMDDLKNESLSNDILKLTDAEISIARKAWSEKKDIFKAEFVENSKSNAPECTLDIINKCKSADDLSKIVKSLSQEDLLEYNDNIDEKFDSFRV